MNLRRTMAAMALLVVGCGTPNADTSSAPEDTLATNDTPTTTLPTLTQGDEPTVLKTTRSPVDPELTSFLDQPVQREPLVVPYDPVEETTAPRPVQFTGEGSEGFCKYLWGVDRAMFVGALEKTSTAERNRRGFADTLVAFDALKNLATPEISADMARLTDANVTLANIYSEFDYDLNLVDARNAIDPTLSTRLKALVEDPDITEASEAVDRYGRQICHFEFDRR